MLIVAGPVVGEDITGAATERPVGSGP